MSRFRCMSRFIFIADSSYFYRTFLHDRAFLCCKDTFPLLYYHANYPKTENHSGFLPSCNSSFNLSLEMSDESLIWQLLVGLKEMYHKKNHEPTFSDERAYKFFMA